MKSWPNVASRQLQSCKKVEQKYKDIACKVKFSPPYLRQAAKTYVATSHSVVWQDTIEISEQRTAFVWFFAQEVDMMSERLWQTALADHCINLSKSFAGHTTGDWFDVKTASICTTELWDSLKNFILTSLKIKVAPYPIIVSLDTLNLSLLQQWRGASTRKRARIAEPTSPHLYAQRTERSIAKASISWNASLPVWPQSGTWPILESWASFVNACPLQFFGHRSTVFGAPGESSFRSPLNPEPWWLLSCNNLHDKHPKHFPLLEKVLCRDETVKHTRLSHVRSLQPKWSLPSMNVRLSWQLQIVWVYLQFKRVFNTHTHSDFRIFT